MDFIIPVVLFIIFFILFSICGYCCKRNKQGIVYGTSNPQITATTTYNTANPPYPVMETPMPQHVGPPAAGFAPHAAYPPTTPYPPAQGFPSVSAPQGYPMPMPMMGGYPGPTPYPPMPMPETGPYTSPVPPYPASAGTQQPPSYAEAVTQPLSNEGYSKQAAYNPNYN